MMSVGAQMAQKDACTNAPYVVGACVRAGCVSRREDLCTWAERVSAGPWRFQGSEIGKGSKAAERGCTL